METTSGYNFDGHASYSDSNYNDNDNNSGNGNGDSHSNDNINNDGNSDNMSVTTPMLSPMTPEAIQQAAAALNIPWSDVEQAALVQSMLASLPLAMPTLGLQQLATTTPPPPLLTLLMAQLGTGVAGVPFSSTTAATTTCASIGANMIPNHMASINIAHDSSMDISPPCTPMIPLPSSPILSPSLQSEQQRTLLATSSSSSSLSPSPSPPLSTITTLSSSRFSILSSTPSQLAPVPGSFKPIQATTYKSKYRTASLLKRNHEHEEPPSVLETIDVTELDEMTLKRAKNTDAARRSRFKKQVLMKSLEQRVTELEVENSMFENKLNEVELERSLLADKDLMQQARIQELEFMLQTLREKLYSSKRS